MYGFRNYYFTEEPPAAQTHSDADVVGMYLRQPGVKLSEIAAETGRSKAEIYRVLHAHGVRPNRLRLGHESVAHLADMGWPSGRIAEFTGYTERNVRYILGKRGQGAGPTN